MSGTWGREIAVERVDGVPYRMYEPRARHLTALLDHADRWSGRTHLVQGETRLDFGDLSTVVRRKAEQPFRRHADRRAHRRAGPELNAPTASAMVAVSSTNRYRTSPLLRRS